MLATQTPLFFTAPIEQRHQREPRRSNNSLSKSFEEWRTITMKEAPQKFKVEKSQDNFHGYPFWSTYTIRDSKTNVCVAIVGDVDRYFEGQYQSIAHLLAKAPELKRALELIANSYVNAYTAQELKQIARDALKGL